MKRMVSQRTMEKMLREIGRHPQAYGPDPIPEDLEKKLRAQMLSEVHPPQKRSKVREVVPMFLRKKVTVSVAVAALLIGPVVLFLLLGTKPMPAFAELVEASEAAAAKVTTLRLIGRASQQDFEQLVKDPFLVRTNHPDGSYEIATADHHIRYDKATNTFHVGKGDIRAAYQEILGPNATATSIFTIGALMSFLKQDTMDGTDVKIEEVAFKGKQAYKATVSWESCDREAIGFFDKGSGLFLRMDVHSKEGAGSLEVVEVNPDLDDSLFSMEPPPGATVR